MKVKIMVHMPFLINQILLFNIPQASYTIQLWPLICYVQCYAHLDIQPLLVGKLYV